MVEVGDRSRGDQIARQRIEAQHVPPGRDRLHHSVQRSELLVARPAILGAEIDAAAVGRPLQVDRIAVVVAADLSHAAAVDVDDEQIAHRVRAAGRLVTGEGHELAVGRHRGIAPVARLRHEIANRCARDVDDVQRRHLILQIAVGAANGVEHDRPAVGRPVDRRAAAQLAGADVPFAARQRPGRAAVGRHHEQVREAIFEESDANLPEVQRVDDARRRRPLGALRFLRHRDVPLFLLGDEHREGDRLAVGRPARIARRFGDVRDLRRRPVRVDPPDEYLLTLRLAVGEIHQPLAVRRPLRVRSLHEEPVLRTIGLDQPSLGFPLVFQLVHVLAGVGDT